MDHPMGFKSYRFSSFLLKLRKEADDREAPGGVFQPFHTSLRFWMLPSNPYQPDCPLTRYASLAP